MLLKKYLGDHYKCIEKSGEILVHSKITRFVGQNEAGKTALLELLRTLRPIGGAPDTFVLEDYPRNKLSEYKRVHDEDPHCPVRAEFEIEPKEIAKLEEEFGEGILLSNSLILSKYYGNKKTFFKLAIEESAFIKHFLSKIEIDPETLDILKKANTLKRLREEVSKLNEERQGLFKTLPNDLAPCVYEKLRIPRFFYFDEYASLPGEISLMKLKNFESTNDYTGDDAESLQTAKALVDFAGTSIDEFLNQQNYERLRADLEAASNSITDQLRRYWTTNKNLEIRFELQPKLDGHTLVDTILHIRIYNTKHRVTVPFRKRSKGFVWFFSFLVAFSEYKDHNEKIILLLDEPGLNLGAVAQRDLIKYLDEMLVPHHQILFTTHSQHMIDPRRLDTVRTVEDEGNSGTQVSNDPYKHNSATLSPLQAALGFDLTQSLFIAPNNVLVEGPADLIYLNLATQVLLNEKRTGLSDEWTIVPVGGADKVATFVSLLGAQGLNLAVFIDASPVDQQKHQAILKNKLLAKNSLLTVGAILDRPEADVEDLFSTGAFLTLVNKSYGTTIKAKDLSEQVPRMSKKLEKYFAENHINNGKFNHYKPAYDLMMNPGWLSEVFDGETKANFERANIALNNILTQLDERIPWGLPARQLIGVSSHRSEMNPRGNTVESEKAL